MALSDLFTPPTFVEIKATIATFAALGNLILTAWQSGTPGEQLYQAFAYTIARYTSRNAQVIRGFFLETATDPGDYDPYNADNETLDPAPGFLSALGLNVFFTERRGATLATTDVTFTNGGTAPQTFYPGRETLALDTDSSITYRNTADATIYTGPGGSVTINPGASLDLPVAAEVAGTASSAQPGHITVHVSARPGVTVTNAAAAIGADREDIDLYKARCRQQGAATSPNGASDAYRYFATTLLDGTPLLRPDETPVGITRIYVSQDSATGAVDVYYADDDGPADADDVIAANDNITLNVIAVPGCITFGPGLTGGIAAAANNITVTWAVEYLSRYAGKAVSGPTVKAAIVAALTARFTTYPIGGFDVVAGIGKIYAEDIRATVKSAHPAIYNATISSPVGDTSVGTGFVAVLTSPTGTETPSS